MRTAIGIDLGTTNSCVAVYRNDHVEVIPNEQGCRITPSCVAFTDVERLIGEAAVNQIAKNPKNSILDAKRLIGRKFSDESVQSDIRLWPFEVVRGPKDKPLIKVTFKNNQKLFAAEEISSMVLSRMKEIAERYLGAEVKEAVVTVPARFNDSQRSATKDAGAIAGLKVMRIINEPTAAALAYGFDENFGIMNVLIFDAGGGTCDVSILKIRNCAFEVVATTGDTHLGGADLDNILVDHFLQEIKRKNNRDITENKRAICRLKSQCEKAKRQLSFSISASIEIDCLDKDFDFSGTITRAKFEDLTINLLEKFVAPVESCLNDAGMKTTDIDDVILVGGSTRIPKLRELVAEVMGGKEFVSNERVHPDEAVAIGAAVQAAILCGEKNGKLKDVMLKDVTPLSLGIEMRHNEMSFLIPRNTPIPAVVTSERITRADNQTGMDIVVYEGERAKASDNNLLGMFELEGIPPAPRGVGTVKVCFDVDADGILNVSATEVTTGTSKQITITNDAGRLSKKEIERMISDAQRYKKEDDTYRKVMEARNSLDMCVYNVQKSMKRARLGALMLKKMEGALREADTCLEDDQLAEEKYKEMVKKLSEFLID